MTRDREWECKHGSTMGLCPVDGCRGNASGFFDWAVIGVDESGRPDPSTPTAKHPGYCRACGLSIEVGEVIRYSGDHEAWIHDHTEDDD